MPATLTITSGRHSLQTVTHGVKPSTRPCPLSKKTAWTASRRNGTGGRHVWLRFQSQTRPSPATTATGHASPASALSATSVPAGDVDDPLLNLRSRSHAMNINKHYVTWRYTYQHNVTWRYTFQHNVTWRYTFQHHVTWRYTFQHHVTWRYTFQHHVTWRYTFQHHVTWRYTFQHHATWRCLHYTHDIHYA